MSIQRKFAILLGLIGLSLLVSLSASLWSVSLFQKELADPFQATSTALNRLNSLKLLLESANATLTAEEIASTESRANMLFLIADDIENELADLTSNAEEVDQLGIGVTRTLEQRLNLIAERIRSSPDEPDAIEVIRRAIDQHAILINRVINRSLDDAQRAIAHGEVIRGNLFVVLALAFAIALMTCSLGLILVRRWILRPIEGLRVAAERIGAGDYEHRIALEGKDEFAQLSNEINEMASLVGTMQQERVERERLAATGEMVRRLTHNLRNPLAGIRGLAEVARAELDPDSDLRATQDRIIMTVDRFELWLSELLESTTPLRIEPIQKEVQPWLASVVDAQRAMAQSSGVELDLNCNDAPVSAVYDPRHLEQALVAIISNAVEVSPPAGHVRITADQPGDSQDWRIQIDDEGPGVPADLVKKVFTANFTTKPSGHGIGLAAARQVVRGHHGQIYVKTSEFVQNTSDKAPGASFVVLLPIVPPTVGAEVDPAEQKKNGAFSGENSHHRR